MEIKRLHQRIGATIVYVTHDQIEAMTMATRIAVMHQGGCSNSPTPIPCIVIPPICSSPVSWVRRR